MEAERFEVFAMLISGLYRDIQRIKARYSEKLGIKTVHMFWLYLLRTHPEGLSASELARAGKTTRALVSREIGELTAQGYVTTDAKTEHRRYGWRFVLTEAGAAAAAEIAQVALRVQQEAGVPEEDLKVFYRTLTVLLERFDSMADGQISLEEET